MAKKKSPSQFSKAKRGKRAPPEPVEENLDRFAGSSDEEEAEADQGSHNGVDVKKQSTPERKLVRFKHKSDDQKSESEEALPSENNREASSNDGVGASDEPFVTNDTNNSTNEEEPEPGEKMAGAMARILGTATTNKKTSVVLAKTTTPLQKMQQKEKEKMKALKEKRQANRERNLAALHIPLSVATTNAIGEGRVSITKELEQERFHRRVATRGVVALFNAISQHQNATGDDDATAKKSDATKLTKHGFLDKIKNTAATMDSKKIPMDERLNTNKKTNEDNSAGKWDALKDDFMMKPKKNWDEEASSEEEDKEDARDVEEPKEPLEHDEIQPKRNKRRKVNARE